MERKSTDITKIVFTEGTAKIFSGRLQAHLQVETQIAKTFQPQIGLYQLVQVASQ